MFEELKKIQDRARSVIGETATIIRDVEKLTASMPPAFSSAFKIGDKVKKATGDYSFDGVVVAVFTKLDPKLVRYVVENENGILHIFSSTNLKHR